jgi:hypothetical protein
MQLNQFIQLNSLNVDDVFEIRKLGFTHHISQINRHNKMYDLISEKIIKAKFKSFERRIKTGGKFKYKGTSDISVK